MRIIHKVALVSFFVLIFCIAFTTSNDFSQDLGRHIKLGELIVQTHQVPKTNLFSYTTPAYPFINHHWLTEVVFYLLSITFGLNSLQILKIFFVFLTVWMSMKEGLTKGSKIITLFVTLLLFCLLFEWLDIRPGLFGYFLFSILFYILFFASNSKSIYLAPIIILFWVNLHISFILGLFLLFIYSLQHIHNLSKRTLTVLAFSLCVSIINPHGIAGILYPFEIWRNFGYPVTETQGILYLKSFMMSAQIQYFILLIPIIFSALIILFIRKKYTYFVLLITFFILPFWQVRHIPFFVLVAIPTVSYSFSEVAIPSIKKIMNHVDNLRQIIYGFFIILCILLSITFVQNEYFKTFDINKSFGIGFYESQKQATDFILKSKLKGKIFNNFDIGGYMIYRLFPLYKVFVDNRPEAYPASFFKDIYISLQENKAIQEKVFKQYDIHTVLFAHSDRTQWGKIFLKRMLLDSRWKVVFLNSSMLIMTDEEKYTDIRENNKNIAHLVESEENYLGLLYLSDFLYAMDYKELSMQAFIKAQKINPSSCVIQIVFYDNDPQKKSWICSSLFSF